MIVFAFLERYAGEHRQKRRNHALNPHCSFDAIDINLASEKVNGYGMNLDLEISSAFVEGCVCRRGDNPMKPLISMKNILIMCMTNISGSVIPLTALAQSR